MIRSSSGAPPASVAPSASSSRKASSVEGTAAIADRSAADIGRTSLPKPSIRIRPSGSRMLASSETSSEPGFGAQLP